MLYTVANKIALAENQINSSVMLLGYRYSNLCVKPDPVSLLPVKASVEGRMENLEHVAQIFQTEDTDQFVVAPFDPDHLSAISVGIMIAHPEFKQDVKSADSTNSRESMVIYLSMPEVDKDRRKALLDATEAFYKECDAKVKATLAYHTGVITAYLASAPLEDQKEGKQALDDMARKYKDMAKSMYKKKNDEIEQAYEKYCQKHEGTETEKPDSGSFAMSMDVDEPSVTEASEAPKVPGMLEMPEMPEAPAMPTDSLSLADLLGK